MTTYIVYRRETWVQAVEVEAKSKEEALNLVYQGHGDMGDEQPEFLENDIRGSMDLSTVEETPDSKKLCSNQCTNCKCRR